MLRWYHVFFIAFAASLVFQGWIWRNDTLTDESIWVERLHHYRDDLAAGKFDQKKYSAHPGLAPLWVAVPIEALGAAPAESLEISVAILVSLIVGGIAAVTYALKPASLWWVAAGGMTALHPLYVQSSIANAVAGPAVALGLVSFILFDKNAKTWAASLMGLSFGIGLITHFSLSLLIAAPVLLVALYKHGRRGGIGMLMALATFALLNPLFLQNPLAHLRFNFYYVSLHTNVLGVVRLGMVDILLISPFAILGFLGGVAAAFIHTLVREVQRNTLFFLLGLTVAVSAALLYAQTQSVRYFFPLMIFWEIMLAAWCLNLGQRSRAAGIITVSLVGMLVIGQAILLTQALY